MNAINYVNILRSFSVQSESSKIKVKKMNYGLKQLIQSALKWPIKCMIYWLLVRIFDGYCGSSTKLNCKRFLQEKKILTKSTRLYNGTLAPTTGWSNSDWLNSLTKKKHRQHQKTVEAHSTTVGPRQIARYSNLEQDPPSSSTETHTHGDDPPAESASATLLAWFCPFTGYQHNVMSATHCDLMSWDKAKLAASKLIHGWFSRWDAGADGTVAALAAL